MRPRQDFLKSEEVEKLHEATAYVLSRVGLRFQHDKGRHLFQKHGAKVEGETVFIPEKLVHQALSSVPESFVLHGREKDQDVRVGGEDAVFASASGPVYVRRGAKKYLAQDEDFINFIKLTETSTVLGVTNYIMVEPQDILPEKRKMHQVAACLKYSTKPLTGITMGEGLTRSCFDLVERFYGGWQENRLLGIISPISPLVYDAQMINHMMDYAEAGQPVLITPCSLPGATSPVSLSGTLVVDNAQVLAGIVFSQLIRPGLPVIYGNTSTACDLRYASPAIGAPETGLITLAAAQLSKYYGIPCRSGGCLTDAKVPDMQAGLESMLTIMPALMGGVDFILQSCGILESFHTLSYEKFLIDEQTLGIVKRFGAGFEINDALVALDMIQHLGPGANFLGESHTAAHFRTEQYIPPLFSREGFAQWEKEGALTLEQKGGRLVEQRLGQYAEPDLTKEQEQSLREYL